MPTSVNIVADSINPAGKRIVTVELVYPRMIHAEIMTYRQWGRNAASSRAIPVKKMMDRIEKDPAMPVYWGKNQAGMQAACEVEDKEWAKNWWLRGRDMMLRHLAEAESHGLHKQIANRIVEPWMHIATLVTATDFANMFHQRNHKDAQPEFRFLVRLFWEAFNTSVPVQLQPGQWHLPFIHQEDRDEVERMYPDRNFGEHEENIRQGMIMNTLKAISVGRCTRVSYLNHNGVRALLEDIELHGRLKGADPGHWSPFEHVAMAMADEKRYAHLQGWYPYRKEFANENILELPKWDPTFRPCHGCLNDVEPNQARTVFYCERCR